MAELLVCDKCRELWELSELKELARSQSNGVGNAKYWRFTIFWRCDACRQVYFRRQYGSEIAEYKGPLTAEEIAEYVPKHLGYLMPEHETEIKKQIAAIA